MNGEFIIAEHLIKNPGKNMKQTKIKHLTTDKNYFHEIITHKKCENLNYYNCNTY